MTNKKPLKKNTKKKKPVDIKICNRFLEEIKYLSKVYNQDYKANLKKIVKIGSTISRIKSGEIEPSKDHLMKGLQLLQIDVNYILSGNRNRDIIKSELPVTRKDVFEIVQKALKSHCPAIPYLERLSPSESQEQKAPISK